MRGIQLIGAAVGVYLIIQVLINYRKKNYSIRRTALMSLIWGVLIVLFLNPSIMLYTLPIFTMEDFILTVLVLSILFVFVLISDIYRGMMENNRKITELVQKLALDDYYNQISEGE